MYISHIELFSWKNFRKINVDLTERIILVGPNASGKSNFLDAIRFLRDLASAGGGLQRAVEDRGGVSKIRCLAARQDPDVGITVTLSNGGPDQWKYEIKFNQESSGHRRLVLVRESVSKNGKLILERPNDEDKKDKERLTQTALEQINLNADFREIARFFEKISYLHLVPQIIRSGREWGSLNKQAEVYGHNFLTRIAKTQEKTRDARLRRITEALKVAVPQLMELQLIPDEQGVPHLVGKYTHWRPTPAKQNEESFSDGTLRLLGLLWSLQEGDGPLLLEEPELSLHSGVVRRLPGLIHRIQREKKRQIFISTHSFELLSDEGISADEVLMLAPGQEGTQIHSAASQPEILALLESGLSAADAVLPHTEPPNLQQLELFSS
jgi:predicted ATPase